MFSIKENVTKNPFIWFQLKMIKNWPVSNLITLLMIVFLSITKDNFMFFLSSIMLIFQLNTLVFIACFFNAENETMFSLPFTAKSFLRMQTIAIWIKSTIMLTFGVLLNNFIFRYNILDSLVLFGFFNVFSFFLCFAMLSFAGRFRRKHLKFINYIAIVIIFVLINFVKEFIFKNDLLTIVFISFVLLIVSNILAKDISFEKIILGENYK